MKRPHQRFAWLIAAAFALALLARVGYMAPSSGAADAYDDGVAALRRRDADAAMAAFARVISADPTFVDAHYRLGLLYGGQAQWKPAVASLQSAVELDPSHADAHCELGEAYLIGIVQAAKAVTPLQRALELEPHHPRALRLLGVALLRLHRLIEAVENLTHAVEVDPGDPDARYLLGLAHYQNEEYHLAVTVLTDLVALWPWHAQGHATLGNAHLRTEDVVAGRRHLRTFEKLYRDSERVQVLERATQADPTNADAWMQIAQQFVNRQEWGRAGEALRAYVRVLPADERGQELLGYVYLQMDAYELALDVYGGLVTQHPTAPEYHNSLGIVYLLLGDHGPAIDHLLRATELDDLERPYLLNLERAYRRAGDTERADETARRYGKMTSRGGSP